MVLINKEYNMKSILKTAALIAFIIAMAMIKQYDDAHIGQYRIDAQKALDDRCARMTKGHELPICSHNFIIDDEHNIK